MYLGIHYITEEWFNDKIPSVFPKGLESLALTIKIGKPSCLKYEKIIITLACLSIGQLSMFQKKVGLKDKGKSYNGQQFDLRFILQENEILPF